MRYLSTPAWVYVMLIVMGIGFSAGAVAFVLFVPQPTGAIVGVIWLLMGGSFVFFSVRALRGRRDDDRIRRQGTAATATLLSANTTGWIVNGVPQWALRLRIDGAGSPYETTLKLMTYNPPSNGATMGVRIDPLRRDHVVLAGDDDVRSAVGQPTGSPGALAAAFRGIETVRSTVNAGAAPDAAETVRLLADLDRMHNDGTVSDAQFEALKEKLLGEK